MKKVVVPEQKEEAYYFSDFTGKPFAGNSLNADEPPVELFVLFNQGSKNDGSQITLHLSDEDVEPILKLIQSKLNPDSDVKSVVDAL